MAKHVDVVTVDWYGQRQIVQARIEFLNESAKTWRGFRHILGWNSTYLFTSEPHEPEDCPWPDGVAHIESVSRG